MTPTQELNMPRCTTKKKGDTHTPLKGHLSLYSKEINTKNLLKHTTINNLTIFSKECETLPDALSQLVNLRVLNIYSEAIAELPESVKNLILLFELRMSSSKLKAFLRNIVLIPNLTHIYMQNNEITTLPDDIGCLKQLKVLKLEINQIKKLPKSVGNLESLEECFLVNNQLTEVPESLGHLAKLWLIELGGNKLSSLPYSYVSNSSEIRDRHVDITNNNDEVTIEVPTTTGKTGTKVVNTPHLFGKVTLTGGAILRYEPVQPPK